ncbi:di-heme-cytochrome C peroxidase [Siccirubricoccus sp. KC 17139]|uniref:Di-heme-cytochrome C peroxidase n=1 Tax=Siccirubricoccus soli TaxID=2899147 RepID=A0ABT1D243_9PROT|nr:di-heme-cytochrome C peroxidase [Siccirubricoccus soli]MCO6415375.1 di-heme-cytochrome C peroxidase [Siccirubricoccus soli]MCP2681507.1 di-heme-cytochrome C peroxidase [Siccirubricoccus soli]
MRRRKAAKWMGLAGGLLLGACNLGAWDPLPPTPGQVPWSLPAQPVSTLPQGWSPELAARFHFSAQGSHLIPRAWFAALNRADGEGRFAAPENLARYGLLFADDAGTGLNPDRLPIGFAIDPVSNPATGPWLGLTCAACHTGEVAFRGTRLRIEGAPARFDFDRFVADLDAAVQATGRDPGRFAAFAERAGTTPAAITDAYAAYAARSARHAAVQRPAHVAGFSRVDALGQIINSIAVLHLAAPPEVVEANRQPPRAPVSYPFLWTAPRQDWVQWVPIASSPIGRNSGEVLGVFGESNLTAPGTPGRFDSSVQYQALAALEDWLRNLEPPAWPEATFGAIDRARWQEGQRIFQRDCQGCHNMPPFRLTDPRQSLDGSQFIRISAVPQRVVGTDRTYLDALQNWRIRTGPLADLFEGREEVAAADYFLTTVKQVVETGTAAAGLTRRRLLDTGEARACPGGYSRRMVAQIPRPTGAFEVRDACAIPDGRLARLAPERWNMPASQLDSLKAGPLLGIWATGPFLHNGSVPTVYDLLSPPAERPAVFWVGSAELDVEKLGFVAAEAPGLFRFDTSQPANSNQGHAFPRRSLTPAQRLAVVEYLKNPQRWEGAR